MLIRAILPLILLGLIGCTSTSGGRALEARSLRGEPLFRAEMDPGKQAEAERQLAEARARFEADPSDEANIIWYGRRLAYLGRFREAIGVYSAGLDVSPGSYRLLRHRGHRYITVREFDAALRDLTLASELCRGRADAIEADGMPNASGVARSTDHSNIHYHHGLVLFLLGRYEEADRAFAQRHRLAEFNDDMLVSTTHWRYLALRRAGRESDANRLLEPIREGMDVRENDGYYRLCRFYQGAIGESEALARDASGKIEPGAAFGVASVRMLNGDREGGIAILDEIVRTTPWSSFGHIAAEADLARLPRQEK